MTEIPLFRPVFRTEEVLAEIRECLEKGWTGLGYKTLEFEEAWRQYSGFPHAHFLNSATAGLEVALRVFRELDGWKDGDEVITTPLTFVATNHAILHAGLRPVFGDVDDSLCLDAHQLHSLLTARTRAVMFVGFGGNVGQLRAVVAWCQKWGVRLVLDAAHMAGTKWTDGRHVGVEADAAVFSLQATKNLPTGDAGMVCFRDAGLDEIARQWTWSGIDRDTYSRTKRPQGYAWQYAVNRAGYKWHGNSIMAAVALVGLRYLDEDNARRRAVAAIYDTDLKAVAIPVSPGCVSSRYLYQIMVRDRQRVMDVLRADRMYTGVHYELNTAHAPFRRFARGCPKAERASAEVLSLPMGVHLTDGDAKRVAVAVREAMA